MSTPSAARSCTSCGASSASSAAIGHGERRIERKRCRQRARDRARRRCATRRAIVAVEEIERGERNVGRIAREHVARALAAFLDALDAGDVRGEIAQRAQAPLADDALGVLGDDAEHAGDAALVVVDRAVRERVVRLLGEAAALEEEQQRLVPGRLAVREHVLDARTDVGPDLGPDLVRARAEHPVALDADGRQVRVVAEERELRTPEHPHRVARIEHHAHDRLQRLRPDRRRAERRRGPVEAAHALADFAAAGEEMQRGSRLRHTRSARPGDGIAGPSNAIADAMTEFVLERAQGDLRRSLANATVRPDPRG